MSELRTWTTPLHSVLPKVILLYVVLLDVMAPWLKPQSILKCEWTTSLIMTAECRSTGCRSAVLHSHTLVKMFILSIPNTNLCHQQNYTCQKSTTVSITTLTRTLCKSEVKNSLTLWSALCHYTGCFGTMAQASRLLKMWMKSKINPDSWMSFYWMS